MAGVRALGRMAPSSLRARRVEISFLHCSSRRQSSDAKDGVRRNFFGIEMLPRAWQEQLFGKGTHRPDPVKLAMANNELVNNFNLQPKRETQEPVALDLPPLQGANIEEHFMRIGEEQSAPYLGYAKELATSQLPPMPTSWRRCAGWVRYSSSHPEGVSVPFPDEKALVFDVEMWVKAPRVPLIAVAASRNAWYSWTSSVSSGGVCWGRRMKRSGVGRRGGRRGREEEEDKEEEDER